MNQFMQNTEAILDEINEKLEYLVRVQAQSLLEAISEIEHSSVVDTTNRTDTFRFRWVNEIDSVSPLTPSEATTTNNQSLSLPMDRDGFIKSPVFASRTSDEEAPTDKIDIEDEKN
jgi:hypothetical protein